MTTTAYDFYIYLKECLYLVADAHTDGVIVIRIILFTRWTMFQGIQVYHAPNVQYRHVTIPSVVDVFPFLLIFSSFLKLLKVDQSILA